MQEPLWLTSSRLTARRSIEAVVKEVASPSGVVRDVSVQSGDPGEPLVFHAESRIAESAHRAQRLGDSLLTTTGAGLSAELALACTLGEALERHCYATSDSTVAVVCDYEQMVGASLNAIQPSAFALYSPAQYEQPDFPYPRFTNTLPIAWTPGISFMSGKETWIPHQFVYGVGPSDALNDVVVAPRTTTGLCCAPSLEEAVLGGICEAVERDAAMCMWANRLPCGRIRPAHASWLAETLAERFNHSAFRLSLYDLTTDIDIPTVMAVLADTAGDGGAAVAVGSAARPTPDSAVLKAALEAAQVRRWLKRSLPFREQKHYKPDFADVSELEDHVTLFSTQDGLRYLGFLSGEDVPERLLIPHQDSRTAKDQLLAVLQKLRRQHLDAIVVDITRPDVAALGFVVVKVLIPGLIDLNADHNHRLIGPRLFAAGRFRGYRFDDGSEAGLNTIPHPFP